MTPIVKGRLWQTKTGAPLDASCKQAIDYYQGKYGDEFDAILVPVMTVIESGVREVRGLRLLEDGSVPQGHLFFRFSNGRTVEED